MFKNNTETNTTETTGYKTQLQLNMSLLLTSALSNQNISINQMIWKLWPKGMHSILCQPILIKMETKWLWLLIHKINMPQEPQVSIMSIYQNGLVRNILTQCNNGFGMPMKQVWNPLDKLEVLFSKVSIETWSFTTGEVLLTRDSTTTLLPRDYKTRWLDSQWTSSVIRLSKKKTSTLTNQIIQLDKNGSSITKVKTTVTIIIIEI